MADLRSVGVPSPRIEGEEKVGGKALYAVDVMLPNLLWVKVLRSPIAHGRIKKIDSAEAQKLPEVKVILTGQDIAGTKIGKKIVDMPQLAEYKGLLHKIEVPSNVFVHLTWNKGDVEEGFRQSDIVVENTFQVPAVHQAYIEPHSCVVQVKPDGG